MDVRHNRIRRVLLVFVCCVCCYVVFYNSLFLDRRRLTRLIPGRLAFSTTNTSVAAGRRDRSWWRSDGSGGRTPAATDRAAAVRMTAPTRQPDWPPAPARKSGSRSTATAKLPATQTSEPPAGLTPKPQSAEATILPVEQTSKLRMKQTAKLAGSIAANPTAKQTAKLAGSIAANPTAKQTAKLAGSIAANRTVKQTTKPPTKQQSATSAPPTGHIIGGMLEGGFLIVNAGQCPRQGGDLQLVILITTAPSHARQRKAIRLTWGGVALRRDVALVFFVGRTDQQLQRAVNAEQATYGDIVQGNFVDSYRNLTLKTVSMLEWLDAHCSGARIVLKTDDDMFINTDNLLTFVRLHWNDSNTLFGRLARRWRPIRNVKSKYYLSAAAYPSKYLPDFMTGPAYVLTGDLVSKLYRASLGAVFLPLEDVLVTGVVGEQLHVKRVHAREFINDRIRIDTCKFQTAISVHMVKFEEQFDIWKRVSDGRTRCPRGYQPTAG